MEYQAGFFVGGKYRVEQLPGYGGMVLLMKAMVRKPEECFRTVAYIFSAIGKRLRINIAAAVKAYRMENPREENDAGVTRMALDAADTNKDRSRENERTLQLAPGVELKLVRVPAGEFLMGSAEDDTDARPWERPQHTLMLEEYWIGKYPVTNVEYEVYIKEKKRQTPSFWQDGTFQAGKAEHPVVKVNWFTARDFCAWLSKKTGYLARLPSEPEWEKAARGTDGRKYPWGNQDPDEKRCNYHLHIGDTTAVGTYSPEGDSPYGCADMAGNVWEWTDSLWRAYPLGAGGSGKALWAAGADAPVARGGSFGDHKMFVRSAFRWDNNPDVLNNNYGFRISVSFRAVR